MRKRSMPFRCLQLLIISLLWLSSCQQNPYAKRDKQSSSNDAFPLTLETAGGNTITIPHKPQRIISLTPSNDEILCELVDEKRIAGLSKYSQFKEASYAFETASRINVFVERNAEQIISLQPDLVIAARYTKMNLQALLGQTKVPVLITTTFENFSDIEGNIRFIGRSVGEEARADQVIQRMRKKLKETRGRLNSENRGLRVLYLASGNFTAGTNTTIHEILSAAGLKNAATEAGVTGHVKIAAEQITQMDPDCILIASGYERDRGFRNMLENDAQLASLKAIREKRIIELEARNVLTVSHHVADAVEKLVEGVNKLSSINQGEKL
ncbi:ABC transporter substrate-binding protein [bacterium]|nr:ABC transporter substrate-binding protein [bacterium]MCI0602263.1 ABC transporter substrate-binding protein [bacterium]